MSDPSRHAKALWAFLEREWAALDVRPTAWCRRVGLADATVLRWREGVEPDMRSLRRVAEALNRPIVEILLAAEYITPADVKGRTITPRTYDLIETIRLDPTLSAGEREALTQIHEAFLLASPERRKRKSTTKTRATVRP